MAILTEMQLRAKSPLAPGQTVEVRINDVKVIIRKAATLHKDTKSGHYEVSWDRKVQKKYRFGGTFGEGTDKQVFEKMMKELKVIVR